MGIRKRTKRREQVLSGRLLGFETRRRCVRILAVLVVLLPCGFALDPDHRVTQYGHTAWTRQEGRLAGAVSALTQTSDGRLWVGTEFGLFYFDGITFTAWQPPAGVEPLSEVIRALEPAQDGGLWIGARGVVLHWGGSELQRYLVNNGPRQLPVIAIRVDNSGNVWIGTAGFQAGGLARIDTNRLRYYGPADGFAGGSVDSLFLDRAGNLWIGSTNGLYRWDGRDFRKYPAQGPPEKITPVSETIDGAIVASFPNEGGLRQFVDGVFKHYPVGRFGDRFETRVLLTDRDGALWVGTNHDGLIHIRKGIIERFTRLDGLSGDTVLSLFEDREGDIWVGTDDGLDRFRDLPVTTFSTREGLSDNLAGSVFASRSNGVWVGTAKGLNRIEGNQIVSYGGKNGLPSDHIGSLFADRSGRLWVCSQVSGGRDAGLAFQVKGRFRSLTLPDSRKIRSIAAVTEDRDGVLWFSDLEHGLISVEAGRIKDVLPWSRFNNRRAWALEADLKRGGIFLGFAEGGIAYYRQDFATRWYTATDGLGPGAVNDLHIDGEGTTWIATQGGLSRLQNDRIATLGKRNSLGSDQIYALTEDQNKGLWLNTACGLQRLTREQLSAWAADPTMKLSPRSFNARDGMRSRPTALGFSRRASTSTDGRVWFPVLDGVAVVDPKNLHENLAPPPVAIEAIRVDGRTYAPKLELRIGPSPKNLEIDYTAFSLVDAERIRFRSLLSG